ncbi:MAG: tetratricopeptide repeat-containing sulfotransferase family protein [Arenimonas sp.]
MEQRIQRLWHRGLDYFQSGNLEAAQASFEGILAREPRHGPARYRLALIASRRGQTQRAIDLCERVLSTEPNRAEVLVHLARSRLESGDIEAARKAVAKAEILPRLSAPLLGTLAQLNFRFGHHERALAQYERVLRDSPGDASVRFNHALALRSQGQLERAIAEFTACLALQPDHAKSHWALTDLSTPTATRNRIAVLEAQAARLPRGHSDDPYFAHALFKEHDALGAPDRAWAALQRGLVARRARQPYDLVAERARVEALLANTSESDPPAQAAPGDPQPIFVIGVPRSGGGVLAELLSRHPSVFAPETHSHFTRALTTPDKGAPPKSAVVRARYLALAVPAGTSAPYVLDRQPMNFLHVPAIRRAFPEARLLHVERDPVDACLSQLSRLFPEYGMAIANVGEIAGAYSDYRRLMVAWHARLPGALLDVRYESLVEKPEMMLRVVCAFLGLRFDRAMLEGAPLHVRRVGHAAAYAQWLPELVALRSPGG